jgi:glycosyltransferase involved in cell wall biosynthesis
MGRRAGQQAMRILFLHNNFPAQFRHMARALAAVPGNQVVFGSQPREGEIPGVRRILFSPARTPRQGVHHYNRTQESAILLGQAAFRAAIELRREGFVPDIIYGHSGWGSTLFMREVFPSARLLCYFEWFYRASGSDVDFLDPADVTDDDACRIRARNAPILMDLEACDWGINPTKFQQVQFPALFREKLSVLHDGIDTEFFKPSPGSKLVLPGLDLSNASEIVTYATRGMEPYRGFPQFMRAAALLMQRRPGLHVVVAGADRVAYSRMLPEGQSWRARMLAELPDLDSTRLHFAGLLPYPSYLKLLQASSAHVYLTVPFCLSWSLLESMAVCCRIVASDTAPVREVMEDGRNGLLVDFFDHQALAERVEELLDRPEQFAQIRAEARRTVEQRFALARLLPRQVKILGDLVKYGRPQADLPTKAVPALP